MSGELYGLSGPGQRLFRPAVTPFNPLAPPTGDVPKLLDLGEVTGELGKFLSSIGDMQGFIEAMLETLRSASPMPLLTWLGKQPQNWASQFADFDLGLFMPDFGALKDAIFGDYEGNDPVLLAMQAVFGLFRKLLGGLVSIHQLTDQAMNLVGEHDFSEAVTIDAGESGYSWDGDHGYEGDGCASVDGNGTDQSLSMKTPIPVAKDQRLQVKARTSWQWVTGPVTDGARLLLDTFLDGVPVSTQQVATITVDGTQPVWQELVGEWTVPDGVDSVAVRLMVPSTLVDGTVRFDQVEVYKIQKLKIDWTEGLTKRFEQIAVLFGIEDTDLDGDVDLTDVWNTLWANVLKALNWVPNVSQSTIDRLVNAFENFGDLVDIDLPVDRVLDAMFGVFSTGLSANTMSTQLAARIRALESAANTIVLDFNGASSSSPGSGFTVTSTGGGAGAMGLNGSGALVWKPSGAGNRTQIARYTTSALTVDNCLIEWILASSPQSYLFDDAYTYICARMDGTTSYLRVRSGYNSIVIQSVVSGTVSTLGTWSGSPRGGDAYSWHIGDSGDARHHILTRNGVTLLDFAETTSLHGATYRHVGAGMETGNRLVITQNIPAGLAVLTASEVL